MKLRTQILLFLLLFGLTPVIAMLLLNMPMAFQQMERFYHDAHLLNLRADFRDLDEQLAGRNESVRLLAKMPSPSILALPDDNSNPAQVSVARQQFIGWLNRILNDQFDITSIIYIDTLGRPLWQLRRNYQDGSWEEYPTQNTVIDTGLIYAGLGLAPGRSMYGPVMIEQHQGPDRSYQSLTMHLISPIYEQDSLPPVGMVVLAVDMSGLARIHSNTLWVFNNGKYLNNPESAGHSNSAFQDYPGLEEVFSNKQLALYDQDRDNRIIWVPMFPTDSGEPLWVGRRVDPSPLEAFSKAFTIRVALLVLGIFALVWLLAHSLAKGIVQYKDQLTGSIRDTLAGKPSAAVALQGPGELQELADNLNQLAELHASNNQALQAHASELEASNRYKSEFLANVSHELRTPLNSILLLSKMLRDDPTSASEQERREQAHIIHRAGNDLKTLIDNILDLSRIEAKQCSVMEEQVDVTALLQDIHTMLEPQFAEKHLSLELQLPDSPIPLLISDSSKIAQIVKNFLSNALKFTESGTVTTVLEYLNDETADAFAAQTPVAIHVKDRGIGIPADQQQHIFEAFRQADGSTNRRYGGTGLGLAISNEMSRILGGHIGLESCPRSGSTFSLYLPLHHTRDGVAQSSTPLTSAPKTTTDRTNSAEADLNQTETWPDKRVLLVTADIPQMLDLTRKLESAALQVNTAADSSEALEHLSEELVDLVITTQHSDTQTLQTLADEKHQPLPLLIDCGKYLKETQSHGSRQSTVSHPKLQTLLVQAFGKDKTP